MRPFLRTLIFLSISAFSLIPSAFCNAGENSTLHELRGVWITNVDSDVLDSREKIAEAMDFLAMTGINVVYPVVWNDAKTLYPSDLMEEEFGLRISSRFEGRDPLAELIVEAHRVGLEVVPWFEYGFAASYNKDGGELLKQRPEWKGLDQEGNLAKKNNFEWMNAFDPEVQDFLTSMVLEVVENYDIDGIQGDDRMPAMPSLGGYDHKTVAMYREEFGQDPPADYKDPEWLQWRADILSDWFEELSDAVHAVDPNLTVSSSPSVYDWSLREYLQDSKTWVERGIVDSIHPQNYRYELDAYKSTLDSLLAQHDFDKTTFAPGLLTNVGSYRMTPEYMLEAIAYNREKGVPGEVHFFYEGLRRNSNELAHLLRRGPYALPAEIPYRAGMKWRPVPYQVQAVAERGTGTWTKPSGAALDKLQLAKGEEGTMTWTLTAPAVDGVYNAYMLYPGEAQGDTAAVTYKLGSDAMQVDQSTVEGWTKVGQTRLAAGEEVQLTMEATGPAVAGPVLLLIDRKAMRR
ncbi:MAG: family 10 glycosylhydrolase [Sumerlaeia bacterium]